MTRLKGTVHALAIALLGLFCATPSFGAQVAPPIVSFGPAHVLSPNFFGVNIEDAFVTNFLWNSAATKLTIDDVQFRSLRFPGGDFSSYYDWRTGWIWPNFLTDPIVAGAVRLPPGADSLANFAALSKATGTYPLYALNVLTRADHSDKSADPHDPPGALLSPGMMPEALAAAQDDQIALLDAALQTYGLPLPYVELGNELFWDTKQDGVADNVTAYPSGAEYGARMSSWASALHGRFGRNIRIAAVGAIAPGGVSAVPSSETPRIRDWNAGVLDNVTGVDAITLHRYDEATWDRIPQNVLALAFKDWGAIEQSALREPANHGLQSWFTEFGAFSDYTGYLRRNGTWRIKPAYTGTWLRGLYDAEMAVQFLSDPRVDQIDLYNLSDTFFQTANQSYYVGGNAPPGAPPTLQGGTIIFDNARAGGLTGIGQAYAMVGRALTNASLAQELTFSGAPTVRAPNGATYPAITGVRLSSARTSGIWLVLNLSGRSCAIRLPGNRAVSIHSLWSPSLMTEVNSDQSLRQTAVTGAGGSPLALPPYSVNLIE